VIRNGPRRRVAAVVSIVCLVSFVITTALPTAAKFLKPTLLPGTHLCPMPAPLGSPSELAKLVRSTFGLEKGVLAEDYFTTDSGASAPTGTSELIGRVFKMVGCSTPLSGATVFAVSATSGSAYRETTDAEGRFDFRGLVAGAYQIIPKKAGLGGGECGPADISVDLRPHDSLISDLYLWPPGSADCYTIEVDNTKPSPPPPRHSSIEATVLEYIDPHHRYASADLVYIVEYGDQRYAAAAWRLDDDREGDAFLKWGADGWTVLTVRRELDVQAIVSYGADSEVAESTIGVLREHDPRR